MTAQEIKDILEKNMSIEAFAFEEYEIPTDFTFSDNVEKIAELEKAAREAMNSCEYYKMSWKERQEASPEVKAEYDKLHAAWANNRVWDVKKKDRAPVKTNKTNQD